MLFTSPYYSPASCTHFPLVFFNVVFTPLYFLLLFLTFLHSFFFYSLLTFALLQINSYTHFPHLFTYLYYYYTSYPPSLVLFNIYYSLLFSAIFQLLTLTFSFPSLTLFTALHCYPASYTPLHLLFHALHDYSSLRLLSIMHTPPLSPFLHSSTLPISLLLLSFVHVLLLLSYVSTKSGTSPRLTCPSPPHLPG